MGDECCKSSGVYAINVCMDVHTVHVQTIIICSKLPRGIVLNCRGRISRVLVGFDQ